MKRNEAMYTPTALIGLIKSIINPLTWLKPLEEGPFVEVTIDKGKCKDCGACHANCSMVRVAGFDKLDASETKFICLECQNCAAFCPHGAIKVADLPDPPPVGDVPETEELLNLMEGLRRSIRTFKETTLTPKQREAIRRAAKCAATGHNNQKLRYTIIEDPLLIKALSDLCMNSWIMLAKFINLPGLDAKFKEILGEHSQDVFGKLARFIDQQIEKHKNGQDPMLLNCKILVLIWALKDERMKVVEATLAGANIMHIAPTIGLGSCISGVIMALPGFKMKQLRKLLRQAGFLKYPDDWDQYELCFALMMGKPKYPPHGKPFRKDPIGL